MYVLHIWDQAGVAFILAKFQQINGNESRVIRVKNADKYGIDEFYKEYGIFVASEELVYRSIEEAGRADVIHIHSLPEMVINIRNAYRDSKVIILHYHGTDIRGFSKDDSRTFNLRNILSPKNIVRKIRTRRLHVKAQKLADRVIVSTPDLIQLVRGSTFLPNPIDTDHFNKKLTKERSTDEYKGILINSEVTNVKLAINYCEHNKINLKIDIYDRTKKPLYYKDIPNFLNEYDVYVDLRFVNRKLLRNLSKTALEALACGLRVLNYNLEYVNNLPTEHYPTNVVTKLSSIYSNKRNRTGATELELELELAILNMLYGIPILLRKLFAKRKRFN